MSSTRPIRDGLTGMYRSPYETLAPASSEHDLIEAVVSAEATNIAATLNRSDAGVDPGAAHTAGRGLQSSASWAVASRTALAVYLHAHLRLIRGGVAILRTADVPDDIAHIGRGSADRGLRLPPLPPPGRVRRPLRQEPPRQGRRVTDPHLSPAAHHADHTLVAEVEGPHLVESYASVVALLDMIIGDLVATNGDAMRRRISRVETARAQLDDLVHTAGDRDHAPG